LDESLEVLFADTGFSDLGVNAAALGPFVICFLAVVVRASCRLFFI